MVVTARRPAEADGALAQQLMALGEAPARVLTFAEAFDVADADLVVDAVLGYGVQGAPRGPVMGLIRAAMAAERVLSLDLPSGIDADSGEAEGFAVSPERTLTLALPKTGLRSDNAGELWLADLGIPPGVYARAGVVSHPIFGNQTRARLRYPASDVGSEASRR
jgi:NAD(P)H-hydrate epimerase